MTAENDKLIFTLDDDNDDDEGYRGNYSAPPQPAPNAELNLALKKIAELEERTREITKRDEVYGEQEAFQRFENQFASIDEDTKKYIKTHIAFAQKALNLTLDERQKKLDSIEKQLAKTEAELKDAFNYINNLDYRTTTNELSKVAMDYLSDEIDLENVKTKSGAWKKDSLDFVKREYALRATNDDKFKQRVLNIANDNSMKPEKREKKLAELMAEAAADAIKNKTKGKPKSQKPTVEEVIKESKKEATKAEAKVDEVETKADDKEDTTSKSEHEKINAKLLEKAMRRF